MNMLEITDYGKKYGVTEDTHYHDDLFESHVKFKPFVFKYLFRDFRIFENVPLKEMDSCLIDLALAMHKVYDRIASNGGTRLGAAFE